MAYYISGIQQIGIGTPSMERAWLWHRRYFSMDIPVFQEAAQAPLMTRYTGEKIHARTATLALNLQGGGGFEIWQFTSRNTEPPSFTPKLGDYGIFVAKIKCKDPEQVYSLFSLNGAKGLSKLYYDPRNRPHFFVQDLHGMWYQVEQGEDWFTSNDSPTGGPHGVIIGVSDIERSLELYRDVLRYDEVIYDETGTFDDLKHLPGGDRTIRRVLITHSQKRRGPFSELLGKSFIELVSLKKEKGRKIYEGRYWGDMGFIHLCFDVKNMDELKQVCEDRGYPFTVDSEGSFDMGEAAGRFAYVEDHDGTLIEFVETHKMPILKFLGWYLDLRKRPPEDPLPRWMLKALSLNRVKAN